MIYWPLTLLVCGFVVAGCATKGEAQLDLIYNKAASYHAPDRNPIVVIPGLMGSSLRDQLSGAVVWGAFDGESVDPNSPEGARLLARPFAEGEDDAVEPTGVLERIKIRLVGIPIQLEVYGRILETLGAAGYRDADLGTAGEVDYGDDHYTCFQFAYDWRKDNVENAARLHAFLLEKQAYVREKYREQFGIDDPQVKFDIVAHSMGGLLTRYFLRYGDQDLPQDGSLPEPTWAGAELVERVVLIAPPNAGSLDALIALVEGDRLGPTLPYYSPEILGTFPSAYQLLPRARHHGVVWEDDGAPLEDLLDPELWQSLGWGLAEASGDPALRVLMPEVSDAATRRAIALQTQRRALDRARAFMAALDRKTKAPAGLEIYLVAGDSSDTPRRVSVNRNDGKLNVLEHGPGDGTVLRSSVLLDEREGREWQPTVVTPLDYHSVLLLPESHLGITKNAAFRDNMLFWLLEEPRDRIGAPSGAIKAR
ncbi:MAG: hypothetical protein O7H39_15795 [Gammaproteobacteria bacterium]|nr:hypothetical protein [Gammaproteobacteria bacterium]